VIWRSWRFRSQHCHRGAWSFLPRCFIAWIVVRAHEVVVEKRREASLSSLGVGLLAGFRRPAGWGLVQGAIGFVRGVSERRSSRDSTPPTPPGVSPGLL